MEFFSHSLDFQLQQNRSIVRLSPTHINLQKIDISYYCSNEKRVDLLLAEPFYVGHDGMLPWQNLRFWKDRTTLSDILSEDALIIPCKGILRACAVSLPDLWKSRCCLSNVEGFDHSVVNATLGACGHLPDLEEGPCLPFFVWQCGEFDVLSETFDVMEFDFSKQICQCQGKSQVKFTKTGVCHGFVLWINWVMDLQNSVVISTGPGHSFPFPTLTKAMKPHSSIQHLWQKL
ncbi:Protein arginine N-methyltransferase 1.6 [Glycine soja]|uniref:Uncharacterized protein n=2 Tax=Glycine subgen. Soja TaxID=1462606 RepID=K7MLK7_SOYBN|nr:Protein arginine N-methyltransferase 1.6 [Glycine soja]